MLPPELHQFIIDVIGDSASITLSPPISGVKEDVRDVFGACSLVCKDWHALTLRHTFHHLHLTVFDNPGDHERLAELFRLLELNPLIRRCIRRHISPRDQQDDPEPKLLSCFANL